MAQTLAERLAAMGKAKNVGKVPVMPVVERELIKPVEKVLTLAERLAVASSNKKPIVEPVIESKSNLQKVLANNPIRKPQLATLTPTKQESPMERRLRLAAQTRQERSKERTPTQKMESELVTMPTDKLAIVPETELEQVKGRIIRLESYLEDSRNDCRSLEAEIVALNKQLDSYKDVEAKMNALAIRVNEL